MGGVASGVSDIFSGIGDLFSAQGYSQAAKYASQNAGYVKLSTGIQEDQATRKAYELAGTTEASAGANNLSISGSALDVMKANASQMSLNKNMIELQGQIDMNGWLEKAAADSAQAAAATASGIGNIIGGALSIFGL